MRRKLLYIGIVLFLLGMASAFMSLMSLNSVPAGGTSQGTERLPLGAGAAGYVEMPLNQSGLLRLAYNSSGGVDLYLMNSSAFGAIGKEKGAGLREAAEGLEGTGVYAAYENGTWGVFPYVADAYANETAPAYADNVSVFPEGTYYAVFSDDGSGAVNVTLVYLSIPVSTLDSARVSLMAYGGISLLLLAVGAVIALASLIMKESAADSKAAARLDEEVEKEYARIDGRGRRSKSGKRKKGKR